VRPLTLDDLLPLDEFHARRDEFFEAHQHYVELYRRVRVGPSIVMVFENRQTLWFRVQELLRVMRLTDLEWVRAELDLVNGLLPPRGGLRASLILGDKATSLNEMRLCCDSMRAVGTLASGRVEWGNAHWIEFALTPMDLKKWADFGAPAWCEIDGERGDEMSEEVRQSLLDDLMD